MAAGDFTLGNFQWLNEWGVRVNGFINACGEAASLMAAHIANGETLNTALLQNIVNEARAAGQTTGAGTASQTAQGVQWDLASQGVASQLASVANLGALLASDITPTGGSPVVLGVSNGAALSGEPAGLRGHFVTVVGYSPSRNAYIVGDPNAQGAGPGGASFDSLAQLQAANPFAAIVPTATAAATGASGAAASGSDACAQQYNCGQFLPIDPRYAYCIGQVAACRAKANITNTATQTATDWTNGVLGGLSADITQATGTNSLQDLGYRTLFVIGGLTLALIGLAAFLFSGAKSQAQETINLVQPGGMGSSGGGEAAGAGDATAADAAVMA